MPGKRSGERFSMTDMLKPKTPLLQADHSVPLEKLEEKFLGGLAPARATQAPIQPEPTERIAERIAPVQTAAIPAAPRAVDAEAAVERRPRLTPRSERKPINIPWSFRMPIGLYERMDRVARRLDINKTDIVLECLELCLPALEKLPARVQGED
jgi:hypothetical protein